MGHTGVPGVGVARLLLLGDADDGAGRHAVASLALHQKIHGVGGVREKHRAGGVVVLVAVRGEHCARPSPTNTRLVSKSVCWVHRLAQSAGRGAGGWGRAQSCVVRVRRTPTRHSKHGVLGKNHILAFWWLMQPPDH